MTELNELTFLNPLTMQKIPIFKGNEEPLVHAWDDPEPFHGENGFGGVILPSLGEEKSIVQSEHAVSAIIRLAHQFEGRQSCMHN